MTKNGFILDKETVQQIGHELWQMRNEKRMYLRHVEKQTGVPSGVIECMEIGKFIQYGTIRRLVRFYGKRMRVVFEDVEVEH